MNERLLVSVIALLAIFSLIGFLLPARVIAEEIQQVFITNFPRVFEVEGTVGVSGPIPHARLARVAEVLVSPVNRKDTLRLISGGTLTMDGFTSVVLSLTGQTKGDVYRVGEVGAILIPDEEPIVRAFEEKGQLQFALDVTAPSGSGTAAYFASSQTQHTLGFPRYRVFFYNQSDKTVTVDLFAYLAN